MRLPRWLFLFWRRRIFLRSTGWERTRRRVFRKQGKYCQRCGSKSRMQVHHLNHDGQPRPKWWHFLPFARFVMFEQDYSKLVVLCDDDHKKAERRKAK